MTIVYGLREVGTNEVRYVGITNKTKAERLKAHHSKANSKGWNYPVTAWIREAGPVEIIQLCACPKEESRKAERRWVERLHSQGARLLNRHLVPSDTPHKGEAA